MRVSVIEDWYQILLHVLEQHSLRIELLLLQLELLLQLDLLLLLHNEASEFIDLVRRLRRTRQC